MILSGAAGLAGVIGWPVAHSRSPRLHGYWLKRYRIDGAYLPLPVRPEDLADALRMLPRLGFRGVNVTVPHKEAALAAVDEADGPAIRIGAVNTVTFGDDGRLLGSNTDGRGFMANLAALQPSWRPDRRAAVVIGAGGAARAIVAALLERAVPEVRLVNRTRDRAETLAAGIVRAGDPPLVVVDWEQRHAALAGAGLVVNCTVLGMAGRPALDLDLAGLPGQALVADIVYTPLETALLAAARARGHPVVDGLGMLLHQAAPGFAAWYGVTPEVTPELRDFVMRDR